MDLIIEDGTGKTDANSYVTLAEAEAFHELQGSAEKWTALSADDKAKNLILAFMDMEGMYRGKWIGQKHNPKQAAAWPRSVKVGGDETLTDPDGVFIAVDEVPRPVKEAQLQVSLIRLNGGTFSMQTVTKDQYLKRKKVDVLEKEWSDKAPAQPRYPMIDNILFGYAAGAYSGVPMLQMTMGLTDRERNQNSEYDALRDPRYFIQE